MECTQRLECTQELYDAYTERTCPEQIGFLGICGTKYPVVKGPNKIGRDPQTCKIVLNLNSISRQHAVINILNSREFMLMDLGSANKTKLENKTLDSYIPHPLKNGDMVQFGDVFGVFRLLEDNDELPMTQAIDIDIPETPAPRRHASKFKAPVTLIPESPDVSDKEDSFITLSKGRLHEDTPKKLSNSQFITPFGKTLPIRPVSSPKTEITQNSRSSLSFVHNPNTILNESLASNKIVDDIHEMETQPPDDVVNESTDSIYTANTQVPEEIAASPSIHSLDTQIPSTTPDYLPEVRRINNQHEMKFDLYAANKENDVSIFNAETQPFRCNDSIENKKIEVKKKSELISPARDLSAKTIGMSDEEVLFDDVDDDTFNEDFNSQALLPDELPFQECNGAETEISDTNSLKEITKQPDKPDPKPTKRDIRIQSDGSTDCEDDLLLTQKIPELPKKVDVKQKTEAKPLNRVTRAKSDSSTDCEDFDMMLTQKIPELPTKDNNKKAPVLENGKAFIKPSKRYRRIQSDSSTDCEDNDMIMTQKIPELPVKDNTKKDPVLKNKEAIIKTLKRDPRIESDNSTDCENKDMIPTKKMPVNKGDQDILTDCEDDLIEISLNKSSNPQPKVDAIKFEDMDTQIVQPQDNQAFEDMPTQVIDIIDKDIANSRIEHDTDGVATQIIEEVPNKTTNEKFKEIVSPFKIPLQSPIKIKCKDIVTLTNGKSNINKQNVDDSNFYAATQDIYDDLCSQREGSPEIVKPLSKPNNSERSSIEDDVVPSSVEDYQVGDRFANIEKVLSPKYVIDKSSSSDGDEKVKNYVNNLSNQQVRDIIGVNTAVSKLKRWPSDPSDSENTPKKVRPLKFVDTDLPNSQEIKTSVSANHKTTIIEFSSDSETENNSDEQCTPILYHKKKRKTDAKLNLTKKLDVDKLPEYVISRVRKPTAKLGDNSAAATNILKPKFLTEQEDQIDKDIVVENIKRLKNKEKSKTSKDTKKDDKVIEVKESISRKKPEREKNAETKEKIKVKIEKPKKRGSKKNESKHNSDASKTKSIDNHLDSTAETITSTRSTRSRTKGNDSQTTRKSTSPENTKSKTGENRKRTHKKQEQQDQSSETEVRRSKRQQSAKEKQEDSQGLKSILKKSTLEQSTVYNASSSSTDSPKCLKRFAEAVDDVPSPKRTRSGISSGTCNVSLRATPARLMKTHHVLFTAFPSDEVKQKLEKLGAVIVTDVTACTVVLTMQIKRTFKLLCAVGLGRPIVGPSWVQACVDTHMIVDPWLYLIKDEATEKRFQFSLERSLVGKRNYLKGYNISTTPHVQPNATEMKLIVECSGGTWKEEVPNWICVSCSADKALWPSLRKRGATVVSTEFILGGVLRQKLDIASNEFK